MKQELQSLVVDRLSSGKLSVDAAGQVRGARGRPVGTPNSDGYLTVTLYLGGGSAAQITRTVKVHQIVWLSVHGSIPPGFEINHVDGDKANNLIANLELVTRAQNMQHAASVGLLAPVGKPGQDNPSAKLTETTVAELKALVARDGRRSANNKGGGAGWTLDQLAARFGVSRGTIHDVLAGRTWTHI